jgi:hypothetical protein
MQAMWLLSLILTQIILKIMEYIILQDNPVIDGVEQSNFINILDITGNTCNCTISNNEATIHSITIINSDVETSVNDYFKKL